MVIDQEQEEEIENCLKSIRKLKSPGLAELNRRIKEEHNIKEEAIVSATTPQVEEQKATSTINVSLKILEVSKEIKKALHVYKVVKEMIESNIPGKQISIMGAKKMIEEDKLILENIPESKANEYKNKIEEDKENPQAGKVEIIKS